MRNTLPWGGPKSLQEEAATSHHADKFCCLDLPNMENSQASLQKLAPPIQTVSSLLGNIANSRLSPP